MCRIVKLLLVLLLTALITACATRHDVQPGFASSDSGIEGRLVTTASTAGSSQITGGARGRVQVTTADQSQQVATVDTDSSGSFEIGLRPGSYFVYTEPMEGMFYGRRVAVGARQMTKLELRLPPQ
jgi:hypothetical protein